MLNQIVETNLKNELFKWEKNLLHNFYLNLEVCKVLNNED